MNIVTRMIFGSHLYGTDTQQSDRDFKSVHIPESRLILLGRAKGSTSTQRPKDQGEKNYAGEIEEEKFSLQRYLGLLAEGQTVALDMLFAPDYAILETSDCWREIRENKHRLLTKKSAAFVGYCRQQANKYGIKGSRVSAMRNARTLLERLGDEKGWHTKLKDCAQEFENFVRENPDHSALIDMESAGQALRHFEVCGRKIPYSVHLKVGFDLCDKIFKEYGARALLAEQQNGIDWKALSHAVRVAQEAIELLETGNVTFPLPNAAHILSIKKGELPYATVAAEIERLLVEVESASERSSLPEKPDFGFIDDFVVAKYGKIVRG
jgi:hypothetical protein